MLLSGARRLSVTGDPITAGIGHRRNGVRPSFAWQQSSGPNVTLGHELKGSWRAYRVRFAPVSGPVSGHSGSAASCQSRPNALQRRAVLFDWLVGIGNGKVVGRIYKGQEGASVWPYARVFPRSLYAGVEAALPTHDALNHHGRDAREHGLGHRG